MRLSEVLNDVYDDNEHATRTVWHDPQVYLGADDDSKLCIFGYSSEGDSPEIPHPWTMTADDWYANDWEVINDG